jgi:hypothetical protein
MKTFDPLTLISKRGVGTGEGEGDGEEIGAGEDGGADAGAAAGWSVASKTNAITMRLH